MKRVKGGSREPPRGASQGCSHLQPVLGEAYREVYTPREAQGGIIGRFTTQGGSGRLYTTVLTPREAQGGYIPLFYTPYTPREAYREIYTRVHTQGGI